MVLQNSVGRTIARDGGLPGMGDNFAYMPVTGGTQVWFYNQSTPPLVRPFGEALVVGDRWLYDAGDATDYIQKEWYFWNGSYWISETTYSQSVSAASLNANSTLIVCDDVDLDLFLCRFVFTATLGATNDASNYWSVELQRRTATATGSEVTLTSIGQVASQVIRVFSDLNIFRDTAALRCFRAVFSRTGAPATISQPMATIYYRRALG